jgi:hypothetical protein
MFMLLIFLTESVGCTISGRVTYEPCFSPFPDPLGSRADDLTYGSAPFATVGSAYDDRKYCLVAVAVAVFAAVAGAPSTECRSGARMRR